MAKSKWNLFLIANCFKCNSNFSQIIFPLFLNVSKLKCTSSLKQEKKKLCDKNNRFVSYLEVLCPDCFSRSLLPPLGGVGFVV